MNVISRKTINQFTKKYSDSKVALDTWYSEATHAVWITPSDIKKRYASASFLKKNYIVFNIKGNKYRIVVRIFYEIRQIRIKWIGTHAEYSKRVFP